jgi:hypothetical protein
MDFARLLNKKVVGSPFEFDAAGVLGDAELTKGVKAGSTALGAALMTLVL